MKVLLFIFIAATIILAALAVAFPELLLNPGPLMKGHQSFKKECLSCHKPFAGVTTVQCISCHKQSDISVRNVAGRLLPTDTTKVLFHRGVDTNSCIDCHTDHRGIDAAKALKPFKHSSLSIVKQKECITCHRNKKPQDVLHRYAAGNCSECHGTTQWKPATFNHSKLTASSAQQCISCHKADQPKDKLHLNITASCVECHGTKKWKPATFNHNKLTALSAKQCITCHKADQPKDTLHHTSQANCGVCHKTTAWKPATFDHNRYFRLDGDHRASCVTCHTEGNYKKYTCYNCHEHSPARIIRKHEKEEIFNYQNCMKCHRDGGKEGGKKEGHD